MLCPTLTAARPLCFFWPRRFLVHGPTALETTPSNFCVLKRAALSDQRLVVSALFQQQPHTLLSLAINLPPLDHLPSPIQLTLMLLTACQGFLSAFDPYLQVRTQAWFPPFSLRLTRQLIVLFVGGPQPGWLLY